MVNSAEKEIASPTQAEPEKTQEDTKPLETSVSNETTTILDSNKMEAEVESSASMKTFDISPKPEDLPPPLPASPPPSEPVATEAADKVETSDAVSEKPSEDIGEVASTLTNILSEAIPTEETIKNVEQIAIETGKQIEEKATNLLKTVEERAEESLRAVGESISKKSEKEMMEGAEEGKLETKEEKQEVVIDEAKNLEETVTAIPVEISNVGSQSPMGEEPTEKAVVESLPVDIACCEPNTDSKDIDI